MEIGAREAASRLDQTCRNLGRLHRHRNRRANTGCRVSNEAEARTSPINPPNLHETGKRDLCCEGPGTGRAPPAVHDRHPVRGPASPTRTATEATCPRSCRFVGPRPLAGLPCHWPGHRATGHSVERASEATGRVTAPLAGSSGHWPRRLVSSEACRTRARNLSAGAARPDRPLGPGALCYCRPRATPGGASDS